MPCLRAEACAGVALAEQQVLLRVRFALIRSRKRVDPDKPCGTYRGPKVQRETGALVAKAGAKWFVGVVEV